MAENNTGNAFGSQEHSRKEKSIEVDGFTIKGHLLRWKDVVIQIENIALVTAVDVKPSVPPSPPGGSAPITYGTALVFVGLYLMSGYYGYLEAFGVIALIVGGIMLLPSIAWIFQIIITPAKKYLDIYLSSGNRYSLLFEDDAFRQRVLNLFSVIFRDGASEIDVPKITINIKDSKIDGDASIIKELNMV